MVENQKICRIIEEFSLYLLEAEIPALNISVSKSGKRVSILFVCDKIEEELLNELEEIFKAKRQHEFEVYGWELIGQGDAEGHELMLVNNLVDYFTYYIRDGKVYFNLVRYE
ncbi:MAG: hypothetical protein K2M08_05755 [Anaeroplasmataceae bacterium]|nr:hypothetical protein [Anaeroplasmataceae bacterium]MDE6408605.1 hypothetical protein [Anaeroplasmataceae bacterium]MDE6414556.1 hypothetical protein [Anaeroplasmataceae bacterium]